MSRLIRCVRSGPNLPLGRSPADGVTVDAGSGRRRDRVRLSPAGSSTPFCCCAATHLAKSSGSCTMTRSSMRACCSAAVLGAIAQIGSRLFRLDPHRVHAIRESGRSCRRVAAPRSCARRPPIPIAERFAVGFARVADRHVQLVCRHDAQVRIANLPPPLMTHDGHFQRVGGAAGLFCTSAIVRAVTRMSTKTIRIGSTVQASSI